MGQLKMGEYGRLSRRSLLLALPSMATARSIFAQPRQPSLRARGLNQMTFSVPDVKRSVDFYQGLFGMPIQARQGETVCLRIGSGPQFLALRPSGAGVTPSISQFGISVEDFDVERTVKALVDHGVERATGIGFMKVQVSRYVPMAATISHGPRRRPAVSGMAGSRDYRTNLLEVFEPTASQRTPQL